MKIRTRLRNKTTRTYSIFKFKATGDPQIVKLYVRAFEEISKRLQDQEQKEREDSQNERKSHS